MSGELKVGIFETLGEALKPEKVVNNEDVRKAFESDWKYSESHKPFYVAEKDEYWLPELYGNKSSKSDATTADWRKFSRGHKAGAESMQPEISKLTEQNKELILTLKLFIEELEDYDQWKDMVESTIEQIQKIEGE